MTMTIALVIYKIMSLVAGVLFGYLGYRLLMSGVWGQAGDLRAKYGDNKLVLKGAAPGTFFAVLGAAVIVVTLSKGLEFESIDVHAGATQIIRPAAKSVGKDEVTKTRRDGAQGVAAPTNTVRGSKSIRSGKGASKKIQRSTGAGAR